MATLVRPDVIVRRSNLRNQSLLGLAFSSQSVLLPILYMYVLTPNIVQAVKDECASYDVLLDLFEHMEGFFKRFKAYSQSFSGTDLAEVLVKVVVKVLNILSLATKEVKQSRTSESWSRFWQI